MQLQIWITQKEDGGLSIFARREDGEEMTREFAAYQVNLIKHMDRPGLRFLLGQ